MADLRFLKGLRSNFNNLTKDANSLYFVQEDDGRLSFYVGDVFIADGSSKQDLTNAIDAIVNGAEEGYANFGDIQTKVKSLEAAVGENGSVSEQIKAAIEGLDSTVSGVSADGLVTVNVEMVDGKLSSTSVVTNDIAKASDLKSLSDVVGEGFTSEETVAKTIKDFKDEVTLIQTDLNNKITAETESRKEEIAATQKMITDLDTTLTGEGTFVDVTVSQVDGLITSVVVAESDIASKTEFDALAEKVNYFLDENAISAGTIDTLKEIQMYIEEHGADAANLLKAIEANASAITAETAARESAISAVTKSIEDEVSRAMSAETSLNNAITAETAARESADNDLSDRLDDIEAVTIVGKDAIVVSASGATENKEISLKLDVQPTANEAGIVLSQSENGLVAKLQWGAF